MVSQLHSALPPHSVLPPPMLVQWYLSHAMRMLVFSMGTLVLAPEGGFGVGLGIRIFKLVPKKKKNLHIAWIITKNKNSQTHTHKHKMCLQRENLQRKKNSWQPNLANEAPKKIVVIQYTSKPSQYIDLLVFQLPTLASKWQFCKLRHQSQIQSHLKALG